MCRKAAYYQLTPTKSAFWFKIPPFGTIALLLVYLGFILGLELINNNLAGAQHYTKLGIRAGWLAIAQVPLLILLAGKNNLIGIVTGISYDRLNILHRWVARGSLLLATLHFGYQSYGWNQYGLMKLEWSADTCPPTGIAAYALLLWLNLSTLAPFRNMYYEIFVVQHLLTFFGFIIAIMYHLPSTALYTRVYIWIPIGLYLLDRTIRTLRSTWNNVYPGRSRAILEAIAGDATKVRIRNSQIKKWSPGAFVLLAIPHHGFGESHPATIASTPTSHGGDLIFILKGQSGFTKRLLTASNDSQTTLVDTKAEEVTPNKTRISFVDGPYGASQSDFACFDSVLLIAGSTGITFTLPILLDLVFRAGRQRQKLPLRRVDFVWVVKSAACLSWISEELNTAVTQLQQAGIDITVQVFVTCDDRSGSSLRSSTRHRRSDCKCDTSLGKPCCCAGELSKVGLVENPSGDVTGEHATDSSNEKMKIGLECAKIDSGRPICRTLLSDLLRRSEGETGVAVCGPLGLSTDVRKAVVSQSSITGAQGIYLHVEGFGW